MALIDEIGISFVEKAITEFYKRAFVDPMICHFFMNSDIEHITSQQIDFAVALLGGEKKYAGLPLPKAHSPFSVRPPHFGRRQILMGEVLNDLKLDPTLAQKWLALEEKLRPLILSSSSKG